MACGALVFCGDQDDSWQTEVTQFPVRAAASGDRQIGPAVLGGHVLDVVEDRKALVGAGLVLDCLGVLVEAAQDDAEFEVGVVGLLEGRDDLGSDVLGVGAA